MAAGATAGMMMLRCVLEGSLVMHETEVERRPYHRNCSCALHNLKGVVCSSGCSHARNVAFSKKKTRRNDCLLSMANSQFSTLSSLVVGRSVKSMESKTSMGFSFMDGENIS
ncbi:hypothetical protein F3Y22_tig00116976pilonHSYRG00119 [Hibiscus syriacus]|uniref:Uncharacterized protein n=1 Tax=Hibiscus syriacus TaxID=106335 RepID=A0A6A2WGK9_HIBSY|nr:uncharacterized protein LOC120192690 [Hibiscus syriacus]KAE8657923.1 hypothetical protein F3Y22_tig00116976pilonHSYRG00119 [Hibiscus syriacus]